MEYHLRGRYYEDFVVGDETRTNARTVTEADVAAFACLTGDFNPLHTNEEYAREHTMYGRRIAHGLLGLSLLTGLLNQTGMMEGTTLAFIESSEQYKAPLFMGDTVMAVIRIADKRPSQKPGRGVVTMQLQLANQRDEVVIDQRQVLLFKTRPTPGQTQ